MSANAFKFWLWREILDSCSVHMPYLLSGAVCEWEQKDAASLFLIPLAIKDNFAILRQGNNISNFRGFLIKSESIWRLGNFKKLGAAKTVVSETLQRYVSLFESVIPLIEELDAIAKTRSMRSFYKDEESVKVIAACDERRKELEPLILEICAELNAIYESVSGLSVFVRGEESLPQYQPPSLFGPIKRQLRQAKNITAETNQVSKECKGEL
jgi:hypothetical protein